MSLKIPRGPSFRPDLSTDPHEHSMWLPMSKQWVDPWALQMQHIHIDDIALALSNICRYNGHVEIPLSVAEHSINVMIECKSRVEKRKNFSCDSNLMLAGLLHDASEAYLGDVHGPSKKRPEYQWYRRIENDLTDTIHARFGVEVTDDMAEVVAEADHLVFTREWRTNGGDMGRDLARRTFLSHFKWLVRERAFGR